MTTATVSDLQHDCSRLLGRVRAGEEIVITQDGEAVARLMPAKRDELEIVDWRASPAVTRDRTSEKVLTAQESLDLIHDAAGKW